MALPTIVFDPSLDPTEPIEHQLIWATDIIGTRDRHEQRRSLRRLPRQSLQFTVDAVDAAEMARIDALLQAGSPDGFKVPMWSDRMVLPATGVSSGLRTNLLARSQEIDDAVWFKNFTAVTANATAAPDGSLTADKFTENDAGVLQAHTVSQNLTGLADNGTYTYSRFVKPAERTWTVLSFRDKAGAFHPVWFDVVNGVIGVTTTGATPFIVASVNGWFRCGITVNTVSGATTPAFYTYISTGNNQAGYIGTVGSGLYTWGAQLEPGSIATDYIPTEATALSVVNLGTTKWEGTWDATETFSPNDVVSFGGNQYIATSLHSLNDQPGWQAKTNPEFASGTTGYAVYDNGASGSISLSTVADPSAPNSTGIVIRVTHTTAGTPSPGFGGIVPTPNILDSGAGFAYTNDTYRRGQVSLFILVAKVPIGYTLNRASNGIGTGNDVNGDAANAIVWLTSQAGTGDWFTYITELRSGSVTPWSTTGHWYITGPSRPLVWDIAKYNITTPWLLDNVMSGYDFIVGDQAIIYQNSRNWELVTVTAVSEGVLTFSAPINAFWSAGTIIAPIKYGYFLGPVSPTRTFRDGQNAVVNFVLR